MRKTKNQIVLDLLLSNNIDTVLEVGGGNAEFATLAAKNGFKVVVLDPKLKPKRSGSQSPGLSLIQTRLQDYASNVQFDAAVMMFVLHSLSAQEGKDLVRIALERHIKPGGILIVMDYSYPKAGIMNWLQWVGIEIDEILTIAQDASFTHYRNFRQFVAGHSITSLAHQWHGSFPHATCKLQFLRFPLAG